MADSIVMMDQVQDWSRGFGFITYEEGCEGTQKAMAAIPHAIRDKYVEIKYSQPKAWSCHADTILNNKFRCLWMWRINA